MKKILNYLRRYVLLLMTAAFTLLLVLSFLFPNRVLDTYEMNLSGPEDGETIIPLTEGSVLWYTMNTGTRPLRGIQPGISLQGGKYTSGVLRCRVVTMESNRLLSDNSYLLSELTQSVQDNINGGGDVSLAWQPLYTYIPFADYESCGGDIVLAFSYESMGETPVFFEGAENAMPTGTGLAAGVPENSIPEGTGPAGTVPVGTVPVGTVPVPGILVNTVQEENTWLQFGGEVFAGGLCGYKVYTHNTYPLVYDLRLLICMFLAASLSAQIFSGKAAGEASVTDITDIEAGMQAKLSDRIVRRINKWREALSTASSRIRGGFSRHRLILHTACILLAVFAALLLEVLWGNGHALFRQRYESDLLHAENTEVYFTAGSGREKLSAEEENTVLRNRENARILAELNGEEVTLQEDGIIEEEDGLYRSVSRSTIELTLPEPQYIHTLRVALPETETGNRIQILADETEVVSGAWIDERIGTGYYVLDRTCSAIMIEITGEQPLSAEVEGETADLQEMPRKAEGAGVETLPTGMEITASNIFRINPVRFAFLLVSFLLLIFFLRCKRLFAEKPEAAFALCSLALGGILIYAVGLNQIGYDEHIHFRSAYERSFGATVLTTESAMQMEASTLPEFQNFEERRQLESYAELNHDYSWANITHQSRFPGYDVRSYLQSAVFLWLGRRLHLPFVWCVMFGKLGNLLLYTLVCYLAVKYAGQGKFLVAAIALLPNCIFAAACYSYDAVVNSFLLLAMVLTINQMGEQKKISWLQTLVLIAAFITGSTAKPIYILMAFLLLLLPKEKFGGTVRAVLYKLCILAVMFLMIYTFFFPPVSASSNYEVMGNLAYAGDKRSEGTNVLGQISYIFSHPAAYTGLLLRSMFGELWQYVSGRKSFGAYGYLGGLGRGWTWAGLLALLGAAVCLPEGEERKPLKAGYKLGSIFMIFGMSAVIWTSMYVTFTAVGADVINGVQGRYFLPLFLPFFACFYQNRARIRLEKGLYARIILGILVLMNLYGTLTLAVLARNA